MTYRRMTAMIAVAAGMAMGSLAYANDPAAADPQDGQTITRADAQAKAVGEFAALDTDHDGFLSPAELSVMMQGMHGDHGGPPPPPPPPAGAGNSNDAAPPPPPPPPRPSGFGGMLMRMADTDHDGRLSQAEFVAMAMQRFDMADTNHDGQLTMAERRAARQMMGGHMHHGGMDRGPGDEGMGGPGMNAPGAGGPDAGGGGNDDPGAGDDGK